MPRKPIRTAKGTEKRDGNDPQQFMRAAVRPKSGFCTASLGFIHMPQPSPSPEQIRDAMESSGYLFEQDVATTIEGVGFHVETNSAFLDRELEKSRELDARAVKVLHTDEANHIEVIVELLVECKDMSAPLVFVGRDKNRRELEHPEPSEYVFPRGTYTKPIDEKTMTLEHAFSYLNLRAHHYYYRETEKATQFAKIIRKGGEWIAIHEGIYDSLILPMAKALEARRQEAKEGLRSGIWRTAWLFFPLVVLRGNLFVLRSGVQGALPEPRQRVSFIRELDSEVVKGHYLTDFVTHEHLDAFLREEVLGFAQKVVEVAVSQPTLFRGG